VSLVSNIPGELLNPRINKEERWPLIDKTSEMEGGGDDDVMK
jgi:hypothetical protein